MPDRLDYQLLSMRNDGEEPGNESKLNQFAEVMQNFGRNDLAWMGVNRQGPNVNDVSQPNTLLCQLKFT